MLNSLSNEDLISSTKRVLQVMREAEVEVLRHFREIEERKLWCDAGSLYKYIELTFGLTADQIYPRLQAMRLMRSVPEVGHKLELGELTVTNALKAQQMFRSESRQRIVTVEEKREVIESLTHVSTKEADKVLAEKFPDLSKPIEKIKSVAPNQNLIQLYVDDETLKQIEELKAMYSHQMPSGKMEDLLKILIRQANRSKNNPSRPKTNSSDQGSKHQNSRYIPVRVKREMEKTRSFGCTHMMSTGKRCGSKHFLQRDHILEFSRGGSSDVENLQWLCGFHNRHRFETRSQAKVSCNSPKDLKPTIAECARSACREQTTSAPQL